MTDTCKIIFYCKDCEKIVDAEKINNKYNYTCKVCKSKQVAFGTEQSINSFYRIKDKEEK
ncbi:hypothetical protein KKG71_06075 [Patescibacteria group bacterium]|nr:hypothetical protein [Patescibacteria group bacterium]